MNIKRVILAVAALATVLAVSMSCKYVKYSFTGAKIHADAKTVSIPPIPNNAAMVSATLSSSLREALQDKFSRQTRLDVIDSDGDLAFEIEITGYNSVPTAISGDDVAQMNRLTITVRASFTNNIEPEYSFNARSFSGFSEYDSSLMLTDVEDTLNAEIIETLVDDIFNAAVSNW